MTYTVLSGTSNVTQSNPIFLANRNANSRCDHVTTRTNYTETNHIQRTRPNETKDEFRPHLHHSVGKWIDLSYSCRDLNAEYSHDREHPYQVQNWQLLTSPQCSVLAVVASSSPSSEHLLSCTETTGAELASTIFLNPLPQAPTAWGPQTRRSQTQHYF